MFKSKLDKCAGFKMVVYPVLKNYYINTAIQISNLPEPHISTTHLGLADTALLLVALFDLEE